MGKIANAAVMAMIVLALISAGTVFAEETNRLEAADHAGNCMDRSGKGWALLAGSGKMTFRGKGLVVVLGDEAHIETDGDGTMRRITPEMTVYRGKGKISVRGEKLAVYIRGEGRLRACGRGFVDLGGRGLSPVSATDMGEIDKI
ncbi:MAG: hypothetical protein ACC644_03705 [Candidatus Hydrothermarchaeales archaeon]